jgi:hypothetical protein
MPGATSISFVPISIGALTGAIERDASVASGLLSTSQNLGGVIGVAVAPSIAGSRFRTLIHQGYAPPAALTGGFQLARWVSGLTGGGRHPGDLPAYPPSPDGRTAAEPCVSPDFVVLL